MISEVVNKNFFLTFVLNILVVRCPRPTEPNTVVSPDQTYYDFNTSVTSDCVLGYNMTAGDTTRVCQHTGEWGGIPPNCTSTFTSLRWTCYKIIYSQSQLVLSLDTKTSSMTGQIVCCITFILSFLKHNRANIVFKMIVFICIFTSILVIFI